MTTWGTTTYAPLAHLAVGDGLDCALCGLRSYAEPHQLVESRRELTDEELGGAVYAVEASDDRGRTYASNGLRWTSAADARHWANGLALRWFGCTDIRVVRITPPTPDSGPRDYTVLEVVDQTL